MKNEQQRVFALLAFAKYVGPEMIEELAAAGEDLIPTNTFEKLAKIKGNDLAEVAESIVKSRRELAQTTPPPDPPPNP
jgi:hypothetical protein